MPTFLFIVACVIVATLILAVFIKIAVLVIYLLVAVVVIRLLIYFLQKLGPLWSGQGSGSGKPGQGPANPYDENS